MPEGTQLSLQQLSPNRALQLDPPNDTGIDKQRYGEPKGITFHRAPKTKKVLRLVFQGLEWKITENEQARRMFAHGMELLPVALTRNSPGPGIPCLLGTWQFLQRCPGQEHKET